MKVNRYNGFGLDWKILRGQQFRQDVYVNGSIVKSDKDSGRFNFNPVRRKFGDYQFDNGVYHVSEGSAYRPPYRNGYVSVFYKGVDIPSQFASTGAVAHPNYGYSLKFDMTTEDVLLKTVRRRTTHPGFLNFPNTRQCFLESQFYSTTGVDSQSKDYYFNFDNYVAMQSFCQAYNLNVPIPETKFDDAWINAVITDGYENPIDIKSYVEVGE